MKRKNSNNPARMVKVNLKLPNHFIKIFDEKIKGAGYISLSDYIRDLVRKDLRQRGLL